MSFDFRSIITTEDVNTVAKKAIGKHAQVLKYSIHAYSEEKIGFLSSHLRLDITVKNDINFDNSLIKKSFFVKSVPYDYPDQASYIKDTEVFRQETGFFKDLVPKMSIEYTGDTWGPRCYLIKADALVLEDLKLQGFKMHPEKLLSEDLIKSGLQALANLHASSLVTEKQLGRPLIDVYPHVIEQNYFLKTGNQYRWYCAGVDLAIKIAEDMNLDTRFISDTCEKVFEAIKPSPTKRNVISHGDLWSNNLMFDDSTPPRCRIIDFQLIRYSPLAADVALFLYLCASRKFRDAKTGEMMKYYYDNLIKCLKMNPVIEEYPSWEEIVDGYEEQKLGAVITATLYFPTTLLDSKLGAKIMNNAESYSKFRYEDRRDIVTEIMKRNSEYNSILKDIVEELVELSLKLNSVPVPN
ncbi:EcKinase 2 [Microplitis demolitor]|uniref:uncharacterized LOC103579615 n=1 Tax=Microplitis demolitor TaxID=69319 RepID=UPI0004CD0EE3|nr:uncharacterized LOC103579615 [Microplitis demolitor]KAG6558407.1 EcKinase 2 [Microplitis demolitor]